MGKWRKWKGGALIFEPDPKGKIIGLDDENPYSILEDQLVEVLEFWAKAFEGRSINDMDALFQGTAKLYTINLDAIATFLKNLTRAKPMTDDEVRVQAGAFVSQFHTGLSREIEKFLQIRKEKEMDHGGPIGRA